MPVLNRIAGFAPDLTEWRQALHRRPELGFDCHETAAYVVERLKEFGVDEIHELHRAYADAARRAGRDINRIITNPETCNHLKVRQLFDQLRRYPDPGGRNKGGNPVCHFGQKRVLVTRLIPAMQFVFRGQFFHMARPDGRNNEDMFIRSGHRGFSVGGGNIRLAALHL